MTAHPTVVDRLVEQLEDLANIVDALDVETFADDDLRAAAQRLTEGLKQAYVRSRRGGCRTWPTGRHRTHSSLLAGR